MLEATSIKAFKFILSIYLMLQNITEKPQLAAKVEEILNSVVKNTTLLSEGLFY